MSTETNSGADGAPYDADSFAWLDSISAKSQLRTTIEVNDFVLLSGTRMARQAGLLITMPVIVSLGAVALCKLPATEAEAAALNAPPAPAPNRQAAQIIPFRKGDRCLATTKKSLQ